MSRGRTLYLLDANVLIDAQRDYYPRERFPELWDWLAHQGAQGSIKIPDDIFRKLTDASDDLATWLKQHQDELRLREELPAAHMNQVIVDGYAPDLDEDEIERVAEDAMLIAYAMVLPSQRCVVTTEGSRPGRKRANRHIPDVCDSLGIAHRNTFAILAELGFRTNWRD